MLILSFQIILTLSSGYLEKNSAYTSFNKASVDKNKNKKIDVVLIGVPGTVGKYDICITYRTSI